MKTLKEIAQKAIELQDGCNLSGIVKAFDMALSDLWEIAREEGKGTDFVNTHVITRVFISKLIHLSKYNSERIFDDMDKVFELKEG